MAEIQDIPRLISEFTALAKQYLLQETVEPAKKLGYFAGMSFAAASLWAIALVLISIAGLRALVDVFPSGEYWEALAYVVFAVILVAFCALLVTLVPDRGVHDTPQTPSIEESP
jgi:L-asparagine transporter-like permease